MLPSRIRALDYAALPSARRRWMRRLCRSWPAGLLLIVAGLGIAYGPGVWRRWQVIKLQEACMTAQMPTDRPVWEQDLAATKALVAAWPGEYALDDAGWAMRVDPRWAAQAAKLGLPGPSFPPGFSLATLFCHERHTPAGRRRLVVVESQYWYVTVIEPAAWPGGDGPRVVWRDQVRWDRASDEALATAYELPRSTRLWAGVPDPADRSRFTAPFVFNGVPGTWEYRLGNDDRVTMRMLDPEGFIARANAAKARAATQPAP